MTPDVNVLVAASRSDHSHHAPARVWVEGAIADCALGGTFRLLPFVLASYLRLVTHPKIFIHPTPAKDAVAYIDTLLAIVGVDIPVVGAEWPLLRQLCLDQQLRGNELPDAWLAAAVMQLDEHLVTFDAGFRKLLKRERLTVLSG